LPVIVNLAIQNHDECTVFGSHWLPAGLEINNPKPHAAKRNVGGRKYALFIRSAMRKLA